MKTNRENLAEIIRQTAEDDLKTLSASSLKLYAVDIEDAFKSEFRKAMKAKYAEVKDTLSFEKRSTFLDIENGYLAQMINWINNNPMNIPSLPYLIDKVEPEIEDVTELRNFVKSRESLFIGGATICLLFSGFKIWAWVAEAIAIAWGVYKYADNISQKKQQVEEKTRALESCINDYIESIKDVAYEWIEKGEAYSEELIRTF